MIARRRARFPWQRLRFRDVVILTAPVVFAAAYISVAALIDYRVRVQFDDWWGHNSRLANLIEARLHAGLTALPAIAIRQNIDMEESSIGIVDLRVDRDDFADAFKDPFAERRWVDARVHIGGQPISARIRRRGDTSVHWTTPKSSFSLRTTKASLFGGYRRLGFSGKEVLSSYIANKLTEQFDVMAPFTALSPVFVNRHFYGLFRLVEPVDESFVRRIERMPGNIFRADTAERGEYYKKLQRNVFENPYIWERSAEVNTVGVAPNEALVELVGTLAGSDFVAHERLMQLVDRQEIAQMLALLLFVGDPYHMSGVHNQFWYEDPSTARLHPVPWDLRILPLAEPQGFLNDFFRAVARDPFVVDRILRDVHAAIQADLLATTQALIDDAVFRYGDYLRFEELRAGLVSPPGTPEDIIETLRANVNTLETWTSDARIRFRSQARPDSLHVIDFETIGFAGSDLRALTLSGAGTAPARLFADHNQNGVRDIDDPEIPLARSAHPSGVKFTLNEPLGLLPGWKTPDGYFEAGNVHYRLFLVGVADEASTITPTLTNRVTGAESQVLAWQNGDSLNGGNSWSPWQFTTGQNNSVHLSGVVHLTEDLAIDPRQELRIEPGTTIRLDPDVSIIARGKVSARGTPSAPIRFEPSGPLPWGTFALQDEHADGSVFEHVTFRGGGGARIGRVTYKGMVSVHWVSNVAFDNCEFVDNLRSDDALNVVHADATIAHGNFLGANSDAIDFDYSSGMIAQSRFHESGNDAIDLMGSSPLIIGNTLTHSGDKGISIGESSHPVIANNMIALGNRGVEIKDRSGPILIHNMITENAVGVLAQVKNWRYGGGGWGRLIKTVVENNDNDLVLDENSMITIHDIEATADMARVTADPASRPDWAYGLAGLAPGAYRSGVDVTIPSGAAARITARDRFGRYFTPSRAPWHMMGDTERLEEIGDALFISVEGRQGSVAREIDWELADMSDERYQLVLELAGRGIERVEVQIASDDHTVRRAVQLPPDQRYARLITMDLPSGRYDQILLDIQPARDASRIDADTGLVERQAAELWLHRFELYSLAPIGTTDGVAEAVLSGG